MASTSAKFGFIKGSPIIDVAELPNPVTKSAINPTGTYDKIYLNTSLSSAEVTNIISKLNMNDLTSIAPNSSPMYIIYANEESGLCLFCTYDTYDNAGEQIITSSIGSFVFTGEEIDYSTVVGIFQGNPLGNPYGWLIDKPVYEIDLTNGVDNFNGLIPIGQQNELLKDLIYVEEVDVSKINTKALYRLPDGTMYHYYNGQWNAVGSGGGNYVVIDMQKVQNEEPLNDEVFDKIATGTIQYLHLDYSSMLGQPILSIFELNMISNSSEYSVFAYEGTELLTQQKYQVVISPLEKAVEIVTMSETSNSNIKKPTYRGYTYTIGENLFINAGASAQDTTGKTIVIDTNKGDFASVWNFISSNEGNYPLIINLNLQLTYTDASYNTYQYRSHIPLTYNCYIRRQPDTESTFNIYLYNSEIGIKITSGNTTITFEKDLCKGEITMYELFKNGIVKMLFTLQNQNNVVNEDLESES